MGETETTPIQAISHERLHRHALKAIAGLTRVNVREAVKVQRRSPVLNEEIHIEEELINLEEAVKTYRIALPTLKQYPAMRPHLQQEKRLILQHCIGLIVRMLLKKPLPRHYTTEDISRAITKLVRIIVEDIRRNGFDFDVETRRIFEPFLDLKLKLMLSETRWNRIFGYQAKYSPVRVLIDRY